MIRLQKCLCCSLRTGSFVIGYLNITLILLSIIALIVGLSLNNAEMDTELKVSLTVSLSVTILELLINGLMVYGVHKAKPGYLIAWLVIKFLGLLLFTVLIVISLGQMVRAQDGDASVMFFFILPLSLVFACYLYLVVYSHYRELCDGPRHSRLYDKATYEFSDTQVAIVSEK